MTIHPGSYGVVRTGGFMGKVIRLATRSQVNHAFVVIDDTHIVEARPTGAKVKPLSEYDGLLVVYNDTEPIPGVVRHDIVAQALTYATRGVGYGFLDIFALALTTFGVRWRWLASRVERDDRLICSQLVDRCYLMAGVHLFDDGRLSGQVTPGDLLLRDAQHPWVARG